MRYAPALNHIPQDRYPVGALAQLTANDRASFDTRRSVVVQSKARTQKFLRIDCTAINPCLVVQVRTGREAGRSDLANNFANTNDLSDFHADFGQMAEASGETVAVTDLDHISVATLSARDGHLASGCCSHRLAKVASQIDPGMHRDTL